jgi:acyl-CoA thioester hydrolase
MPSSGSLRAKEVYLMHITYRGTVFPWHCDHMGHMNVMWYVGKFDEATWTLGALMGMTAQYLREMKRGMAAVEHRIAYRREAFPGDVLTIRSAIVEIRPKAVRFVHEMRRGDAGDHLATMLVTGVHIDAVVRKATAFDPQVVTHTKALLAPDPTLWDQWPPEKAFLE